MAARVIAVASGKGGVGKSTFTVGISRALASMGLRVLAVDCDIGLRSLDLLFGVQESVVFDWGDVLDDFCEPEQALLTCGEVKLLSAPANFSSKYSADSFSKLIKKYGEDFDCILIDAPAGITVGFLHALAASETGIIVANPDDICVRSGAIAADVMRGEGLEEIRLVINRFEKKRVLKGKRLNIDDVIDNSGVRLIGVVPEDAVMSDYLVKGECPPKKTPSAKAFLNIAKRLEGKNIPLKL